MSKDKKVDTKPELKEAASIRWKKAGPNGEIQAIIGGKKYQIETNLLIFFLSVLHIVKLFPFSIVIK